MSPKLQLVFANESSERPYHLDSGSRPQVSAPPGLLICCSLDYLSSLHLGHVRWESGFLHGPGGQRVARPQREEEEARPEARGLGVVRPLVDTGVGIRF